jgi:pilus assembly protein Flp/PilA
LGSGFFERGFQAMANIIWKLAWDESGATALEYGLIAGFVSVAAVSGFNALGNSLEGVFTAVHTAIAGVVR